VVLMGYYQDFKRFPEFFSEENPYFDAMLCVDLPPGKETAGNIPLFNEQDSRTEIKEKLKNKPAAVQSEFRPFISIHFGKNIATPVNTP